MYPLSGSSVPRDTIGGDKGTAMKAPGCIDLEVATDILVVEDLDRSERLQGTSRGRIY